MTRVLKTKTTVKINLSVIWLHHRPECPIEEVSFLKDKHRHTFTISCEKEVSHNDRDVEIIMFKNVIKQYLEDEYYDQEQMILDFWRMSCEDIANELVEMFWLYYCEVLEDWENWAVVRQEMVD